MSTEAGDVAKLPKWAQKKISLLENNVSYWQERAGISIDAAEMFAHAWPGYNTGQAAQPIAGDTIYFKIGEGSQDHISIKLDHGKYGDLEIHSPHHLSVTPYSMNTLHIKAVGR